MALTTRQQREQIPMIVFIEKLACNNRSSASESLDYANDEARATKTGNEIR